MKSSLFSTIKSAPGRLAQSIRDYLEQPSARVTRRFLGEREIHIVEVAPSASIVDLGGGGKHAVQVRARLRVDGTDLGLLAEVDHDGQPESLRRAREQAKMFMEGYVRCQGDVTALKKTVALHQHKAVRIVENARREETRKARRAAERDARRAGKEVIDITAVPAGA